MEKLRPATRKFCQRPDSLRIDFPCVRLKKRGYHRMGVKPTQNVYNIRLYFPVITADFFNMRSYFCDIEQDFVSVICRKI